MKRIIELRHNAYLQITLLVIGLFIFTVAVAVGPEPVNEVVKEAINGMAR